jgi:hypothetical protein
MVSVTSKAISGGPGGGVKGPAADAKDTPQP